VYRGRIEATLNHTQTQQTSFSLSKRSGKPKTMKKTGYLFTSLVCFALCVGSARAALSYWDANGTAPGAGVTPDFVAGWGLDAFWSSDPTGTSPTGPWTPDDTAVFCAGSDAVSYTIALAANQFVSGMIFKDGLAWIRVRTITLTGAGGPISVTSPYGAKIDSTLAGTNGLTKTGSGTLFLISTSTNTYTSPDGTTNTFINEGALSLGNGCTNCGRLLDDTNGNHHIVNNGTLIFNYDLDGPLWVENFYGVISGTGSLVKKGRTRLWLNSVHSNTFSGDIIIEGGRLSAGGNPGCAIPTGPGKGNVYVNLYAQLDVAGNDFQINGLSGPGNLTNSYGYNASHPAITNILRVGGNDQSSVFRGIIPEGSKARSNHIILRKVGSGTLTVTGNDISTDGNNSAYVLPVVVAGGTLLGDNQMFSGAVGNCDVIVNSGATLGGWGRFKNPVTINAGGTLSPGDNGIAQLTFNNSVSLAGHLYIEVNKVFPMLNESLALSNDVVRVDGALTKTGSGTVTVANLGPPLKAGDTFYLFRDSADNIKALSNGQVMSVVSVGGGVVWSNRLEVNGSIVVVSATAPPASNTNLTITANGPGSFTLLGVGAAASPYKLLAYTNVTTPSSSWWALATNYSDSKGMIQFQDIQAADAQRFYQIAPSTGTNPTPPSGMVYIPAGSFTMGNAMNTNEGYGGDELPLHDVYVSAFYMDRVPVTKALWQDVYNWAINHGYNFTSAGLGKFGEHPVQTVNWYDCAKWCNARSEKEGLTPAYYTSSAQNTVFRSGTNDLPAANVKWNAGYRLPTEAEWEKASRGGAAGQRFPWGDTISWARANFYALQSDGLAYDVNPDEGYNPGVAVNGPPYTCPAGLGATNGYGLYDMSGNVWQWCYDWWDGDWYTNALAVVNDCKGPAGPVSVYNHVLRGGSWFSHADNLRCSARNRANPFGAFDSFGFRCVKGP